MTEIVDLGDGCRFVIEPENMITASFRSTLLAVPAADAGGVEGLILPQGAGLGGERID